MKLALVLALVAVAQARNLQDIDLEDFTAFDYLAKYGLPLAEKIRAAEEANIQNRIVGGSPAALGQYPYQVGLLATFSQGSGVCGGSLISTNRVLTAAHCWFDSVNQATSFEVVLGSTTLFTGGVRMTTSNVIMHNEWMPTRLLNDIAMILLPSPVSLSSTIAPIALPSVSQMDESFVGETAVASGFGLTTDDGSIGTSQVISHVSLNVISNFACSVAFPNAVHVSNICTSGAGGKGICSGDSGGPLAVSRNGQPLLIGITSFVSAWGCQARLPSGFTRVTSFLAWINQHL